MSQSREVRAVLELLRAERVREVGPPVDLHAQAARARRRLKPLIDAGWTDVAGATRLVIGDEQTIVLEAEADGDGFLVLIVVGGGSVMHRRFEDAAEIVGFGEELAQAPQARGGEARRSA